MANGNNRGAALRITALTAALLGVYGVAGAAPSIDCSNTTCNADGQNLVADAGKPVVQAREKAVVNITGGSIKGNGKGEKGVLAMSGSTINVDNVANLTTIDAHSVQAFGVDGDGNSSKVVLNGSTINTTGLGYALGVQAYDKGEVSGTNTLINTSGVNGSGVEAERGGVITLTSGHIKTTGDGAAGARAYGGTTNVAGRITLDGMHIETAGGSAIGLMAGDEDGPSGPRTAGNITFRNANVLTKGADSVAARVEKGSRLVVENGTLRSNQSHGLVVRNAGSTAVLDKVSVQTGGAGTGWHNMPVGVHATDGGSVEIKGGSVQTTETYTRGILATTGGQVTTDGTAISTKKNKSHAVQSHVEKDDTGSALPSINIKAGTITTEGDESWGLYALRGGQITSSAAIDTQGKAGFGVFVEGNDETNARAGLIKLNGGSVTTHGGVKDGTNIGSYGVLAKNKGNRVEIDGTSITTFGAMAEALRVEDGASIKATNAKVETSAMGVVAGTATTPVLAAHAAAVLSGSSLELTGGSFTTLGDGFALYATDAESEVVATNTTFNTKGRHGLYVTKGATATLVGGSIKSTSASSTARAVTAEFDSQIKLSGTAVVIDASGSDSTVVGVQALDGASVTLDQGTSVLTTGASALGLRSTRDKTDAKSSIIASSIAVETRGGGSHAMAAYLGSSITANDTRILTKGQNAYGAHARDSGKLALSNGSTITTEGIHGYGAAATGGGEISLSGGSVTTTNTKGRDAQDGDGARAYALYADGAGSSIVTQNATKISTQGQRSYGAHAINGGSIKLNGGSIETHGFMAYGAYASGANSTLSTNNVNITTTGNVGDAVWAYQGGVVTLNGGVISVGGEPNSNSPHETAKGLLATGGSATKTAGTVNANNVTLTTRGSKSAGAVAGSTVGDDEVFGTINLDNTSILTEGANSNAAHVSYGSTLTAKNNSRLVSRQSNGIVMTDNATVTLDKTTVEAKGASLVADLEAAGATQNITIRNGSTLAVNNGTLLQVNRNNAGQDGNVNLTLATGTFASGNVDDRAAKGTGKTTVLATGAHWAGIHLKDGDKVVEEGATETYGDVTGNVVPAANSTVTFTPGAQVTGSVSAAQGSTTTFTGNSTITGEVASQGGTMVFGGNANIGSSVTATQGSSFSFGGTTQIGAPGSTGTAVAGQGASFGFSRTAPTTINGDVVLTQGSSVSGGSSGAPVQIVGNTSVSDGARLGGNLVITGQLAAAGGVVSPGNSIGTVRVGSVASFPSTYAVEVNAAGASDLMIVDNGNVDLSASALTVGQENGNGGYVLNHDYTIIQMPGNTLTTEFKSATLDDSFANTLVKLDPVKYGKTDVKIALSPDTGKVSAKRSGLSANQNATLDGVISVAGRNASADAALLSTDTGAVLNQLSGELHASTQSALLNSSSLLTNTIAKRMRGNVGAGLVAGAPVAQSSGTVPAGAMPSSSAYPLWAEVVGNWSSLDGNSNAAKVKSDTAGLFVGGDVGVGKGWRLGATLGFTDGKIKVNDRSSRSDVRSYTAAIYGGNSWATAKGSVNFLAGAGYTRHDVDSRRTVTVGGNQTLKADYKANTTHLFTELGYAMPVGKASVVEPYLGLAWISQRAKGFDESGGSAALHGQSQTDDVTTFTLGARGKTTVEAGRHEVRLSAGAGWRHAAGDVDASRKMSFIQGNGATFQVAGAPIAKNAAVVDLGAEMTVGKNAAMGLGYSGQFGNGNTDSTGSLYLKVRFK